jgi:hypothetical protein
MSFFYEFDDEDYTRLQEQIAEDTAYFNEVAIRETQDLKLFAVSVIEAREKRKQAKKERKEKGRTKKLTKKVWLEWLFFTWHGSRRN